MSMRGIAHAQRVMGVSGAVTATELKERYHKLVHMYHPDKNPTDPHRIKDINAAYKLLKSMAPSEAPTTRSDPAAAAAEAAAMAERLKSTTLPWQRRRGTHSAAPTRPNIVTRAVRSVERARADVFHAFRYVTGLDPRSSNQ